MATKAKAKTKRKPAKRRTSKKVGGSGTITLSGIRYTRESCHTTAGAAKKKAKDLREKGYTARVKGKCVYKGRKRKK